MIDRADDIMTTQGPHETRSERWIYLQNIMKSLQVSSFWILELWSTICFLRSRDCWPLDTNNQLVLQAASKCPHFNSLHFTSLQSQTSRTHSQEVQESRVSKLPFHPVQRPQENSCRLHHYSTTSGQISSSADCKGYLMILLLQTWRDDSKHVTVRSRDRLMISHRHFSVRSQINKLI